MENISQETVVITLESKLGVDEAVEALRNATTEARFGVVGYHDLNATMAKKGVEFGPQVRIVEICQPGYAKRVLEQELEISAALPCRISVFEREGRTWLSTVRPTAMLGMFAVPGAGPVAEEVETIILNIMEAARG